MARKKKKRSGLRDFSNVNIKLNIPWNDKGQGNKTSFFANLFDNNPEFKEYLTKESFEKLYNTDFNEFQKESEDISTSDPAGDALALIQSGNMSPEQIQAFLQSLLGQTTFGEITNFEFPDNSVGNNYTYAFGDGTPLFNPDFIQNLQQQLDTLGLDLDDLNSQLSSLTDENNLLVSGSDSLETQNGNLIADNAALLGENAALKAALALEPVFTGTTPEVTISGDGSPDPVTGIARRVQMTVSTDNATSRTLSIYQITPGSNEGVSLDDSNLATDVSGNQIKEITLGSAGTIFFGTSGGQLTREIEFESESVYVFQLTAFNNGGDPDNPEPKSVQGSALFTTVDTDEAVISGLQGELTQAESDITDLQASQNSLQSQITDMNTQLSNLNNDVSQLTTQRDNAVNTLDGFSDNIVQKINSLKSALEQENITDTTLTQVNALISSFNTFVPNINSNTPPTSPVTQITEFDRFIGSGEEDSSDMNPPTYPEWLGGDGITEVDDDNVLFDLDGLENTPWFNIPELTYSSVPNELEISEDNIQDKILVAIRPHRIKYIFGGLTYPYMFARGGNLQQSRFQSNKAMFAYETGKLYDYTQDNNTWFNQINQTQQDFKIVMPTYGKRPSLRLLTKTNPDGGGSTIYNTDIGLFANRTTYKGDLIVGQTKHQAGNRNLMSLAGYDNYDSYGYDGVYMVNGGNSFKFELDKSIIPYRAIGFSSVPLDGTHTYSIGLQFDFIVRQSSGNFIFKSRKVTGNFSFSKAQLQQGQ